MTDEERAALVTDNMALAWFAANQFSHLPGFQDDLEDFVGCALIGMVKASKAFDPKRAQFSTCAMFYARTEIINYMRHRVRWNTHIDSSITNAEQWPDEETLDGYVPDTDYKAVFATLTDAIDSLPPRWSTAIRAYYGIGREPATLEKIGKEMKVTKERVRQLLIQATERLRHYIERNQLTYRDGEIVRAS